MVGLSERELRRYVDFAHETTRVARVEPRRLDRWVVDGVAQLIRCDGVSHIESSRGVGGRFGASLKAVQATKPHFELIRNDPEIVRAWNERLAYELPTAAYRFRHPFDLRALRMSDFITLSRLRRLEVYDVISRPLGTTHTINAGYRAPGGLNEIVCARTSHLDFSDAELMLLDLAATAVGLATRDPTPPQAPEGGLTAREAEVLERVARGCSNAEIAEALSVAPGTVKKHLDNIYAKLGVRNRTQAARAWLEATAASEAERMRLPGDQRR